MQQSSATQSLHLSFWGLRKIVACSHSSLQCLLVSTVFGTVSSLHPTSFLMIFILVIICTAKSNTGSFPCTTTYDLLDGSKVICLRALGGVRVRGCGYMYVT